MQHTASGISLAGTVAFDLGPTDSCATNQASAVVSPVHRESPPQGKHDLLPVQVACDVASALLQGKYAQLLLLHTNPDGRKPNPTPLQSALGRLDVISFGAKTCNTMCFKAVNGVQRFQHDPTLLDSALGIHAATAICGARYSPPGRRSSASQVMLGDDLHSESLYSFFPPPCSNRDGGWKADQCFGTTNVAVFDCIPTSVPVHIDGFIKVTQLQARSAICLRKLPLDNYYPKDLSDLTMATTTGTDRGLKYIAEILQSRKMMLMPAHHQFPFDIPLITCAVEGTEPCLSVADALLAFSRPLAADRTPTDPRLHPVAAFKERLNDLDPVPITEFLQAKERSFWTGRLDEKLTVSRLSSVTLSIEADEDEYNWSSRPDVFNLSGRPRVFFDFEPADDHMTILVKLPKGTILLCPATRNSPLENPVLDDDLVAPRPLTSPSFDHGGVPRYYYEAGLPAMRSPFSIRPPRGPGANDYFAMLPVTAAFSLLPPRFKGMPYNQGFGHHIGCAHSPTGTCSHRIHRYEMSISMGCPSCGRTLLDLRASPIDAPQLLPLLCPRHGPLAVVLSRAPRPDRVKRFREIRDVADASSVLPSGVYIVPESLHFTKIMPILTQCFKMVAPYYGVSEKGYDNGQIVVSWPEDMPKDDTLRLHATLMTMVFCRTRPPAMLIEVSTETLTKYVTDVRSVPDSPLNPWLSELHVIAALPPALLERIRQVDLPKEAPSQRAVDMSGQMLHMERTAAELKIHTVELLDLIGEPYAITSMVVTSFRRSPTTTESLTPLLTTFPMLSSRGMAAWRPTYS